MDKKRYLQKSEKKLISDKITEPKDIDYMLKRKPDGGFIWKKKNSIIVKEAPVCEECNELMNPCGDSETGESGWSCDLCGWYTPAD